MPDPKDFSVAKSKSPYKIQQAPPFKRDASETMEQAYLRQRADMEANDTQHKQLVANLDSLSSDFVALFTNLSTIRGKLNNAGNYQQLDKQHSQAIRKIIKLVDLINGVITNKIIPLIDDLGK